jgi:hypothetical protein
MLALIPIVCVADLAPHTHDVFRRLAHLAQATSGEPFTSQKTDLIEEYLLSFIIYS